MNDKFITTVYNRLKQLSDPGRKRLSEWYFPTSMEVLGVNSAGMKIITSAARKELKGSPPGEVISICKELCRSGIFECQQAGFGILNRNQGLVSSLTLSDLLELGTYMDNWVSTDSFSTWLAGPAWRFGAISDNNIIEWAMSDDKWWRRNALVSTVGLNLKSQGGTGDPGRTIMICKILVGDRDDMVVKALSWALRELSKSDKGEVRQFMTDFESLLPGRVKREVTNKLETGRKN